MFGVVEAGTALLDPEKVLGSVVPAKLIEGK